MGGRIRTREGGGKAEGYGKIREKGRIRRRGRKDNKR